MKYIFLLERTEINGIEQDPSIGLLHLPDNVAKKLISSKKAVEVRKGQVGPLPEGE